jgi:glutamate-1-semialdehyde 2,1-aminomutase
MSRDDRFAATHKKSRALWERAIKVSRGFHTDPIVTRPFSIYITHAKGSRKWDVDGNEYIDYLMGFGALLLGHAHPAMVEAVQKQIVKGTHYGGENELELEWAERICKLIPCAEKIEFILSGSEADMLIARLARAYTGRSKILKFAEHYFGWAEDVLAGIAPPYDKPFAGQIPPFTKGVIGGGAVVIPCNDEQAMEEALAKRDIAAFFVEGGGANCGRIGMKPEMVKTARELTKKYGTLLVIDEVISGFRWSKGGYQSAIGVTPDLSPLAKLNGGGIPGGAAVCGRADIMDLLQLRPGDAEWNRFKHVIHRGTWNGNPLTAAAAVEMLKIVEKGEVQKIAAGKASHLADGIQKEFAKRGIEACCHNATSVLHLHLGKCEKCDRTLCLDTKKSMPAELVHAWNGHLILNGVHLHRGAMGMVSPAHTDADIEQTIEVFGKAMDGLLEEGVVKSK